MIKINKKGFTLIELMVAITILAILAIVGLTLFSGLQAQARDSNRRTEVNSIATSMEAHYIASASTASPAGCADLISGSPAYLSAMTTPTYCPLESAWFTQAQVPFDPSGTLAANTPATYCMWFNTDSTSNGQFKLSYFTYANWPTRGQCPAVSTSMTVGSITSTLANAGGTVPGQPITTTSSTGTPYPASATSGIKNFIVCARMEASQQVYCEANQQR